MNPSHAAEQAAVAPQLIEALAKYEKDLGLLVQFGLDPELAQRISDEFDMMRAYASVLPAVSVTWVELLISRFELTHAMWASRNGGPTNRIVKLHQYHLAMIAELRGKCARYLVTDARY